MDFWSDMCLLVSTFILRADHTVQTHEENALKVRFIGSNSSSVH